MLECFYPRQYLDSTYQIDFEKMYALGYRGVIFDIDNTLVPHDAPADRHAVALFGRLKNIGYKVMLLSNNKELRVKKFGDAVGSPYIYKSGKPNPASYRAAMKKMGTDRKSTMFVGDQIFTDVWGANMAGIYSILVKPINPKEEIQIVLKRIPEKIVLASYKRHIKKTKGTWLYK